MVLIYLFPFQSKQRFYRFGIFTLFLLWAIHEDIARLNLIYRARLALDHDLACLYTITKALEAESLN